MHNLISYNQLAGWKQSIEKLSVIDQRIDDVDNLNDYYNCLIECDEKQHVCKRICRELL
jgi:hypothetical protein